MSRYGLTGGIEALVGFGRDQEDWYKIVMPANGTFKYSATNLHEQGVEHAIIDTVALFDERGEKLTHTIWLTSRGKRNSPAVSVSAGQTYYLQVQPRANSSAPYSLSLSLTPL